MIPFSYLSLLSQKYQVSNLEEDAKFFELLKIIEDCPLVVQKRFPYHSVYCAAIQNRSAAKFWNSES